MKSKKEKPLKVNTSLEKLVKIAVQTKKKEGKKTGKKSKD